jgi:hypothetical protein
VLQAATVLVPFLTAVVVAVIAKLQFSKDPRVGSIPPNTTVYSLLAQQDVEISQLKDRINKLNERVSKSEEAVKLCELREKELLRRLGLESG